jgi:hypothetical protein
MRKLSMFIIILLLNHQARADHLFGGDISFTCLGNNQYHISVNFYRDCIAAPPPDSITLNINNSCGAIQSTAMLYPVGGQIPLTTNCSNTTCTGNGLNPGVDKTEFTATITLTGTCSQWILSANPGDRTSYVNIFDQASAHAMYLETTINNTVTCDDSPDFIDPEWIVCASDSNCLVSGNAGPGDSTVWSLIAPRENANQLVPYLPGYSVSKPFDTINTAAINPSTGEFCFYASSPVWSNYTVQATNYRNGIITGQSMRDMTILLTDCSALPEISGMNGGPSTDTVCRINNQMCYDVYTSATSGSDSTTIYWDFGINGSFTKYPGQFEYATFCWTPQLSDTGLHCFETSCYENACPGERVSYKTFCVYVLDSADYQIWLTKHDELIRPVKVFPQPFNDHLNISLNKICKKCLVKIFDERARDVFEKNYSNTEIIEIDMQAINPGIYTIQLINSENSSSFRVIKFEN